MYQDEILVVFNSLMFRCEK